MKQHKWHKEIKAWADGAEIEWANAFEPIGYWQKCVKPDWDNEHIEYRIKPQPKEPQYFYLYQGKTTQYIALSDIKRHDKNYNLIGRIQIESEWEE